MGALLWRVWRFGGGDWTLPWRMYHGLDEQFRPLDDPAGAPVRIRDVPRYRALILGFGLANDVILRGAKDKPGLPPPAVPGRTDRERVRPSGLILPTGVEAPRG